MGKNLAEKKVIEIISNTNSSTQYFVLIPNMIFVWSQTGLFYRKSIEYKPKTTEIESQD
jgi:hypothetical protein